MTIPHFYLKEVRSERIFPLAVGQVTTIGREYDCQIVLESQTYGSVSRRHAAIRSLTENEWEICDLGSSNGTLVNGRKLVGCQRLNVGDRLVLGDSRAEFVFCSQPSEVVPTPVASGANVSLTQLVPILSTGKQLGSKGFLIPGIVTVVVVVSMFGAIGNFQLFRLLLGLYLGIAGFGLVYFLCGKPKPWWLMPVLLVPALITILMIAVPVVKDGGITFTDSPVLDFFFAVFRHRLPGNVSSARPDFISQFVAHFFGAGLMEELMKACPIFLFYALGLFLPSWWRSQVGVNEPLDGILLGASSAMGFTLIETLGQYVPAVTQEVSQITGQETAGELIGVQLLIPRVLGSVAGHIAYSGYFGYFIGLFALKPNTWFITLPVGYLTASLLHAFWNASASLSPNFALWILAVVGVISYIFLVAAILKARAISPTRTQNFSTRIHR